MYLRNNHRERSVVEKYQKNGYEVLTKGWPDLLVFKNGEVIMIEVKRRQKRTTTKMGLSQHQRKMHEVLRSIGLKVNIEYV